MRMFGNSSESQWKCENMPRTSRRRNESGKSGRSSPFVVCNAICWRAEPLRCTSCSVFLTDEVPGANPDKKKATTTEAIMYIPGTPPSAIQHEFSTCECSGEGWCHAVCLRGKCGKNRCQNKNKWSPVTTHRTATVTLFPPQDAFTAACHYTSKRVLTPCLRPTLKSTTKRVENEWGVISECIGMVTATQAPSHLGVNHMT